MSRVDLLRTVLRRSLIDANVPSSGGMTDEDKFYESSRTDSGFLSGGNLVLSGEIVSEELEEISEDRNAGNLKTQPGSEVHMRLDSGLDLTESLSNLSLDRNSGYNDLSSTSSSKQCSSTPFSPSITPNTHQSDSSKAHEANWDLYNEQDEDGNTLLHAAILQRFQEAALALIRGAPHPQLLDTPNNRAESPLHLAVGTGQWRVARWLIIAGAKPCPRNRNGDSPLHLSAQVADVQCCKAINDPIQQQERDALSLTYTPSYQASDLNQWNYQGQTCVHVAAMEGHVDILRHLVWYGADINAREGNGGYTAFHYAVENQDEHLMHYLLSECKSLNVHTLSYGGKSVLQLGYELPCNVRRILLLKGVRASSPSEDEYDSDDSDISDDMAYDNHHLFNQQNIPINASA